MIFAFFFIPLLAFSDIIQDDVSILEKNSFSFKTVCIKSGIKDSPLIEVSSGTELDCMSKKVSVIDFCDREMATDPYLLRAYIDEEKKKVTCVSGKKVYFRYLCVKLSDKDLCSKEAEQACREIKSKLARRLDIAHSSFVKNPKGIKQLNCFFESTPKFQ